MKKKNDFIIRADGFDKVTGKAKYVSDYYLDGMLYVGVVHSTYAHAKIISIDTTEAEKIAYVYTYKDLANNVILDIVNDRPVLAQDKVRFMGEAVAVVASKNKNDLKKAISLVKVEYEPLPIYLDAESSMKEDSVSIAPDGNIAGSFENTKGDIEKGFSEADFVLERDYEVPHQEHAYMEPDANFSFYDNGELVLYTSSQSAFNDQRITAHALGISESKVRVVSATVGGAFGGKDGHMTQIFGALVTYKTGLPAKIVFDRKESIAYTYKRHSAKLHIKIGFKNNGKIIAFDSDTIIDTGAYIGYGYTVLGLLSEHIAGPYNIPNVHIKSKLVYTNTTTSSAFRGFGAPQAMFATESLISEASFLLGIDPLKIRLKNALKTGDVGAVGQKITATCGIKKALKLMSNTSLWKERKNKENFVGYGIACGHLSCGFGKSIPDYAEIEMKKNNEIYEFYIGFTEIGQGGLSSMQAIAVKALNTTPDKVKIIQSDTKTTYNCGSTAASRSTFIAGNAIIKAIKEYKEKELIGNKNIVVKVKVDFPEPTEKKGIGMPHAMYTYVVQAVKVKVNNLTGKVDVLDAVAVTEAGNIINAIQTAGQVSGGMVQSLGYALSENITFREDGTLNEDDFSKYIIPTFLDVPSVTSLHVKAYEKSGPFGAKGMAESPTVPTAGAVNSAIFDATGKWHYKLPITAESVLLGEDE